MELSKTIGLRAALLALMLVPLSGCGKPATAEDRTALEGDWLANDGSAHRLYFAPNGTFQFEYSAGTVWQLHWDLGSSGQIKLSSYEDHVPIADCNYIITGNVLHIDNGQGAPCAKPDVTPDSPIPLGFNRG